MTIASATTPMRARYVSTAGQTVFSVPFPIYDEADFEVYVNGSLMTYDVSPANATQYSIGAFEAASTNITFGSPGLNDGDDVLLVNDIPVERTSDFASSGVFPITTLNKQLDKLTAMVREREDFTDMRVLRLAKTDFPETLGALPVKATRASKLLAFDANGDPTAATQTLAELEAWFDGAEAAAAAAAASETAAGGSESAAAASAAAALASELAAAASEAAADADRIAAAASAATASGHADTAYANALVTNGDVAATGTNATNAAASAVAAADSLAATLAAYDNFDDRYLGAKTSDPALDNDGNALVAGALYFNTTAGAMKVYTGSVWSAAYVAGSDFLPLVGGTMTGAITLAGDPVNALHAATKQYVDAAKADILDGFTATGNIIIGGTTYGDGQITDTGTLVITNGQQTNVHVAEFEIGAGGAGVQFKSTGIGRAWIAEAGDHNFRISSQNWGGVAFIVTGSEGFTSDEALFDFSADPGAWGGARAGIQIEPYDTSQKPVFTVFDNTSDRFTVKYDGALSWYGDVGLARDSAGVLKVTNGAAGDGRIKASIFDGAGGGSLVSNGPHFYWFGFGAIYMAMYTGGQINVRGDTGSIGFSPADNALTNHDIAITRYEAGVFKVTNGSTGWGEVKSICGINSQTGTTYTLVIGDVSETVEMSNASANTLTVPPNSSVAFPIGARVDVVQMGAGQTTLVAGSGVTIRSKGGNLKLTGQYSGVTLYKRATDEWVAIGDLSA